MPWLDLTGMVMSLVDQLQWYHFVIIGLDYLLKFIALGWVPSKRRPSSAMAWLLAIFLIPFIGILLFFLIGSPQVNKRRHEIQMRANELIRDMAREEPDMPEGRELTDEQQSMVQLNRKLTSLPAVGGTLHELYSDYAESIRKMAQTIDTAKNYVNVQIYIMAWDETTDVFFQALARAADRGVKARLMYDHVGSMKYPESHLLGRKLDRLGIEWYAMLPLKPWRWKFRRPDLRNHRKVVVVDGERAFMGSQNMIDASYLMSGNLKLGRQWVDIMGEFTGPIVTEINSVFALDWFAESGESLDLIAPTDLAQELDDEDKDVGEELMQVLPSGPGFTTDPNLRMFVSMVHHAKEHLQIVSPYFIPDESLLEAVTTAAYRGVRVELYVSEKADQAMVGHAQASYYEELLEAGVKIYQYPAPAVLHTKAAIADKEVAVMGSSNMDMRSFGLNYEITMVSFEGKLMNELDRVIQGYKETSKKLTKEQWAKRPWHQKYVDNVARLTSALQ